MNMLMLLHLNCKSILLIYLQEEAMRVQQEAEEQLAELQQQLQEQLLAAGSLTERVLSAEASSTKVSMHAFTWHPSWMCQDCRLCVSYVQHGPVAFQQLSDKKL